MVGAVNVVVSDKCDACKMCKRLLRLVHTRFPDVELIFHDATDSQIQRFMHKNLSKPISTIENPEMREYYRQQGINRLTGLPTIYITTTQRPMRIMDLSIGCIGTDASMEAREQMTKDLQKMFNKARLSDRMLGVEMVGRYERRDPYG